MYEDTSSQNGKRVLVDRLWPRGMSKERAHLDEWLRDVAPSADLRHWRHHDQERFAEFRDRCIGELEDADHRPAVQHLCDLAGHDKVTLPGRIRHRDHEPVTHTVCGTCGGRVHGDDVHRDDLVPGWDQSGPVTTP
ncbi:DUF488 domain-containing protein [Streptomyces sp. NBC_01003]|uniref:DUF488 domain-containing protein n=1 Tax=Streptomyces sp. NBC_01003 TaxID=2903714 RepID=UPI003865EB9C